MNLLVCGSEDCAHNRGGACVAGQINVRGYGAFSSSMTRCATYTPSAKSVSNAEFGDEMTAFPVKPLIGCNASQCVFNKDGKCSSERVEISDHTHSKECRSECNSFIPE